MVSDFVPVPCCFPTCNSVTYAFIDGETGHAAAAHRERVRLSGLHHQPRHAGLEPAKSKRALEGLWSSSSVPGSQKSAEQLAFSCQACGFLRASPWATSRRT